MSLCATSHQPTCSSNQLPYQSATINQKPLQFLDQLSPGRFKYNTAGAPTPLVFLVASDDEPLNQIQPGLGSPQSPQQLPNPVVAITLILFPIPPVPPVVPFPGSDGSLPRLRGLAFASPMVESRRIQKPCLLLIIL